MLSLHLYSCCRTKNRKKYVFVVINFFLTNIAWYWLLSTRFGLFNLTVDPMNSSKCLDATFNAMKGHWFVHPIHTCFGLGSSSSSSPPPPPPSSPSSPSFSFLLLPSSSFFLLSPSSVFSSDRCEETISLFFKMAPFLPVSDSIRDRSHIHVFVTRSCLTLSILVFVSLPRLRIFLHLTIIINTFVGSRLSSILTT